jgi:hypothetical protein
VILAETNKEAFEVVEDFILGYKLLAKNPIPQGSKFFDFKNHTKILEPNYKSIQVSPSEHIYYEILEYMNHSCEPNVAIDTNEFVCIALRDIKVGEQLTFFYPSTEWSMSRVFECQCKSEHCIGTVSGASDLPINVLKKYYINEHIVELTLDCLKKTKLMNH